MSRKILVLLSVIMVIACNGTAKKVGWIDTLPKPWLLTESEISEILPEFQKQFPNFNDRLKAFTLWRVGTPYDIFKLGEEKPPDTDPIIRLDVSDCTVHVLTSLAFVQSSTWDEARQNLIEIHYKPDPAGNIIPSYDSRWHFTTDRILSNPSTVNITDELLGPEDLTTIELGLNIKEDGEEFLDLNWSRQVQVSYIPNAMINKELFEKVPEVCGIDFVRKDHFKNGIIIGHEGILIDQKYLIHASSTAGETVKIDIIDYYFGEGDPFFDGIMVYKFVPLK